MARAYESAEVKRVVRTAQSCNERIAARANAIGIPVTPAGVAEIARFLAEEGARR